MELSPFWFGLYKAAKFLIYPYTWLSLSVGVLTVLLFLPTARQYLHWIRVLAVLSCVVIFALGNPYLSGILLGLLEHRADPFDRSVADRFDAIVVLGGGVERKGTLRPRVALTGLSMRRTACGADLFAEGWAPRLLLSGGDASVFGEGAKESIEMKRFARRLGVPESAILVDTRSRNTYENAVQAKRILEEGSVLVVTSASHVPRALALFRKQGLEPTGYPCGYLITNRPGEWSGNVFDLIPSTVGLSRSSATIQEVLGLLLYSVLGKA